MKPDLQRAIEAIVEACEGLGLTYALGGAVAMGFCGVIRATRDVDVLVSVPALRWNDLARALAEAGLEAHDEQGSRTAPDPRRLVEETRERGLFRVWWADIPVEVFVPKVALQRAVLSRRVRVELGDRPLWLTTAEDLILLKMIFHRPKDLEDVRRLVVANRDELDVAYLEDWAERTLEPAVGEELRALLERARRRLP